MQLETFNHAELTGDDQEKQARSYQLEFTGHYKFVNSKYGAHLFRPCATTTAHTTMVVVVDVLVVVLLLLAVVMVAIVVLVFLYNLFSCLCAC